MYGSQCLLDDRQRVAFDAIQQGETKRCAAEMAGVGRSTLNRWLGQPGPFRDAMEREVIRKRYGDRTPADILRDRLNGAI